MRSADILLVLGALAGGTLSCALTHFLSARIAR